MVQWLGSDASNVRVRVRFAVVASIFQFCHSMSPELHEIYSIKLERLCNKIDAVFIFFIGYSCLMAFSSNKLSLDVTPHHALLGNPHEQAQIWHGKRAAMCFVHVFSSAGISCTCRDFAESEESTFNM